MLVSLFFLDVEFRDTFLMTYRAFTTKEELLALLHKRYPFLFFVTVFYFFYLLFP